LSHTQSARHTTLYRLQPAAHSVTFVAATACGNNNSTDRSSATTTTAVAAATPAPSAATTTTSATARSTAATCGTETGATNPAAHREHTATASRPCGSCNRISDDPPCRRLCSTVTSCSATAIATDDSSDAIDAQWRCWWNGVADCIYRATTTTVSATAVANTDDTKYATNAAPAATCTATANPTRPIACNVIATTTTTACSATATTTTDNDNNKQATSKSDGRAAWR